MWTTEERAAYTANEVAEMLHYSARFVRAEMANGNLASQPTGDCKRVTTLAWIVDWQDRGAGLKPPKESSPGTASATTQLPE